LPTDQFSRYQPSLPISPSVHPSGLSIDNGKSACVQVSEPNWNSYDAEQGIAGGISVDITTKTGTNSIHGSVFEFHTDRAFQAYQWGANGALPKPEYINNQFGGTIGGPIKKDKLFYFVSYQGTYVNVGNALYAENPTAAMKTGDLSASPSPIYDPSTGDEKDCLPCFTKRREA
jgi:hypothetical protein